MASSRTLLSALALGFLFACGTNELPQEPHADWPDLPAGASEVDFRVLEPAHTTGMSGFSEPRREVIRTQEAWEAFWAAFQAGVEPQADPPEVDFAEEMVIAAAMGTRPTAGFQISVEEIHRADERLIVRVLETSPGEGCMTAQVITSPVTAVRVDATGLEVEFAEGEIAPPC